MQAAGVQPAALEPRLPGILEAAAECGPDQWHGGLPHTRDQSCAQCHREQAEGAASAAVLVVLPAESFLV